MGKRQQESVFVFNIMLESREEGDEAFGNVGGSIVVEVEVGVGIVSAR